MAVVKLSAGLPLALGRPDTTTGLEHLPQGNLRCSKAVGKLATGATQDAGQAPDWHKQLCCLASYTAFVIVPVRERLPNG